MIRCSRSTTTLFDLTKPLSNPQEWLVKSNGPIYCRLLMHSLQLMSVRNFLPNYCINITSSRESRVADINMRFFILIPWEISIVSTEKKMSPQDSRNSWKFPDRRSFIFLLGKKQRCQVSKPNIPLRKENSSQVKQLSPSFLVTRINSFLPCSKNSFQISWSCADHLWESPEIQCTWYWQKEILSAIWFDGGTICLCYS